MALEGLSNPPTHTHISQTVQKHKGPLIQTVTTEIWRGGWWSPGDGLASANSPHLSASKREGQPGDNWLGQLQEGALHVPGRGGGHLLHSPPVWDIPGEISLAAVGLNRGSSQGQCSAAAEGTGLPVRQPPALATNSPGGLQ